MQIWRRWLPGALFALLLSQLFGVLDERVFGLEQRSLDLRFQIRGPRSLEHSPLVLVEVDNRSYKDLNERFPFPRAHYARALRNLKRAGVKQILLDIQFTERVTGDSAGLADLAAAIRETAPVVLSGELVQERHNYSRLDPPLPELMVGDQPWGLVNDLNDRDGVNRLYPLFWPAPGTGELLPALGAWTLLEPDAPLSGQIGELQGGRQRVGTADVLLEPGLANAFRINYYGPAGSFPTYSFSSVMDDATYDLADLDGDSDYMELWYDDGIFDAEMRALLTEGESHPFKDRIALIGVSATDLHDDKLTPYFHYGDTRRMMPGVEVHAHAIQTMLDEAWISRPLAGVTGLLPPLLLALAGVMVSSWLGPFRALFLLLPLAAGHATLAQWLFSAQDLWIELAAPLMALGGAWTFALLQQFLAARRERAQIRGMFAQYVPEAVVSELIKDPEKLVLGGEERAMSALFSDVEGFTSISENLTPTELVELLNEYLTAMTQCIVDQGGIIDKYEGDAIIAEFGAPLPAEDHALRAARASIHMQRELAELRVGWKQQGRAELQARIGINSGLMVVGNMGSRQIFDYTAMGDAMNLASRLEGVNKFYRSYLMVSRDSWDLLGDGFLGRCLDQIRVKGKSRPVEIWELLEMKEGLAPEKQALLETRIQTWNTARELYLKRDWSAALEAFSGLLKAHPEDGPASVFALRCAGYQSRPPAEDWDGVENMTDK